MRVLTWIFRLFVFLVLLGFALSNTEPATLRFFGIPEFEWRAPLVLFLLVFFVAGALAGVLSAMPLVLRQRRLTSRLRKDAAAARAPDAAVPQPGSQDAASRALTVSSGGFHGL
jgi:putative membrane protein